MARASERVRETEGGGGGGWERWEMRTGGMDCKVGIGGGKEGKWKCLGRGKESKVGDLGGGKKGRKEGR